MQCSEQRTTKSPMEMVCAFFFFLLRAFYSFKNNTKKIFFLINFHDHFIEAKKIIFFFPKIKIKNKLLIGDMARYYIIIVLNKNLLNFFISGVDIYIY